MIRILLVIADNILDVFDNTSGAAAVGKEPPMILKSTDTLTGKSVEVKCCHTAVAAILALALAGDGDLPENTTRELYEIAEPVVTDWDREVRPIP